MSINLVARCSPSWIFSKGLAFSALCCPVPTFLRPVAGIKFKMSLFSGWKCKISLFKHLLCSLCSIVNKHWLMWFESLLVLILNEWMMHLYSAFCVLLYTQSALQSCRGVSPQPPPVCSIHLDDATAATGQRHQCAHHTPATGGEKRES